MQNSSSTTISKIAVARHFNRVAEHYEKAAVLINEIGERLLERLDFIKLNPKNILDLGSGTGVFSQKLAQKYPDSTVFSLDISENMLNFSIANPKNLTKTSIPLCADAEKLPLAKQSCDLIFSNCCFHWCFDINALFAECKRILKPGGLFIFTTFGPDTLKELRDIYWDIDPEHHHINLFIDMHNIGDLLLHFGFIDPVMDMEYLSMHYQDVAELHWDLKATGENLLIMTSENSADNASNILFNRNITLGKLSNCYERYRQNGELPATFEVIYGHAFGDSIPEIEALTTENLTLRNSENLNLLQKKEIPIKINLE